MKIFKLGAAAVALAAPLALTIPAARAAPASHARTNVVSGCNCWGGYVAHSRSILGYHTITAVWKVPSIPASSARKVVDFWVGLGGDQSTGLEQIGIGDVSQNGKAYYIPWYEALSEQHPTSPPVNIPKSVKPGDFITASVTQTELKVEKNGDIWSSYRMTMSDNRGTNNTIWTVPETVSGVGYYTNSAEAILENSGTLPDFGQVTFDGVSIDGKDLGSTNPVYETLGANPQKIFIHPIIGGDSFTISWVHS